MIEKVFLILVKLEMAGHPNIQLKEDNHEIYDRPGKILIELAFVFVTSIIFYF
jgi:hypothetical protein